MSAIDDCVAELRDVADLLARTSSLRRRDPARWLEERDALAQEVRRIAGRLAAISRQGRTLEIPKLPPDGRPRISEIVVDGRTIRVMVRGR